jgi:hypothetical protein
MKVVVLVATIGDKMEVEEWITNHEKYFDNPDVNFIVNNSNQDVIEVWDKLQNIDVYHTPRSGIIDAFNFLVSKISPNNDYFIHAGIDDIMINICDNLYQTDLVFIPVIDAKRSGAKKRIKVRRPFSYFLNNRPYAPHHQGCLYATRLAESKFYADFGICFDAHKTLKIIESGASFIVDNETSPMFEMWEGGLSSNVEAVLDSNKRLTSDLNWKPSWRQEFVNKYVNKLRYGI